MRARRHCLGAGAGLALAVGVAAGGQAETIDRPDAVVAGQVERWPSRLCPDDPRTSADRPMRNDEQRMVGELFGVTTGALVIQYRSPDWSGPEAIAELASEILGVRPRLLSPFVDWAEGADLRRHGFVARMEAPGGAAVRLAVAGYQVCLRDAKGRYWYFRNVPGDLGRRPARLDESAGHAALGRRRRPGCARQRRRSSPSASSIASSPPLRRRKS